MARSDQSAGLLNQVAVNWVNSTRRKSTGQTRWIEVDVQRTKP